MQVTAVHNNEFENKRHVGTYLERTWNVLGTYSERIRNVLRKGVVKRRGREDTRKEGRGKQGGKTTLNHALAVENVPGTYFQWHMVSIKKRRQGEEN